MYYTLTLNPALDYVVKLSQLNIGNTNRSEAEELRFGGKGINVSYILSQLGVDNIALGFIAGFTGDELQHLLKFNGIKTDFIRLNEGNTRINIKIKGQKETEINASGPVIDETALEKLFKKLDVLKSGDTLVLSGSVPKSLPDNIYEQIMQRLCYNDVRFVVDASKDVLLKSLKFKPFLIKPNIDELCETLGVDIKTDEQIISAAEYLRNRGAKNVLVSRGEKGAVLLDSRGFVHYAPAHSIKPLDTVGAGDSMVAGFLAGFDEDLGYENALRLALAAGGATAASENLATKEEIYSLLKTDGGCIC